MRKLAAIMFTDLVGYSALSQKDDALAWAFEITDKGIVRIKGPKRHQPKKPYHS